VLYEPTPPTLVSLKQATTIYELSATHTHTHTQERVQLGTGLIRRLWVPIYIIGHATEQPAVEVQSHGVAQQLYRRLATILASVGTHLARARCGPPCNPMRRQKWHGILHGSTAENLVTISFLPACIFSVMESLCIICTIAVNQSHYNRHNRIILSLGIVLSLTVSRTVKAKLGQQLVAKGLRHFTVSCTLVFVAKHCGR
jgi:hypothetical protein